MCYIIISTMIRNYKYRLYPNKEQVAKLVATLEVCKNIHNKCLEERIKLYKEEKKSISAFSQIKLSKQYGISNLGTIYAQVHQQVVFRLDNSFKNFFRRVKNNEKPGFPRFKNISSYNSFTYSQGGFWLKDTKLKLSKIGEIKIKLHRPLVGKVKRITISRNSLNQWFACFVCEQDVSIPKVEVVSKIGIDMGCKSFIADSNGATVEHPHYYRVSEEKLKKTQSKYSKIKKLSRYNRKKYKLKKKLSKLHNKVANQRNDFLHKLSRNLLNKYDLICVEDLNIKSMTENNFKNLNKSILDSGWCQFTEYLTYKAESAGKYVMKVNPAYTSQICSSCGTLVKKDLSVRIHTCTCGLSIDRDTNAARNILALGTKAFEKSIKASN